MDREPCAGRKMVAPRGTPTSCTPSQKMELASTVNLTAGATDTCHVPPCATWESVVALGILLRHTTVYSKTSVRNHPHYIQDHHQLIQSIHFRCSINNCCRFCNAKGEHTLSYIRVIQKYFLKWKLGLKVCKNFSGLKKCIKFQTCICSNQSQCLPLSKRFEPQTCLNLVIVPNT